MVVLDIRRIANKCTNTPIIGGVDFRIRGKRLFKVLNPGKDKGAAVLGVLDNVLPRGSKSVLVGKGGLSRCAPGRLTGVVTILPRRSSRTFSCAMGRAISLNECTRRGK